MKEVGVQRSQQLAEFKEFLSRFESATPEGLKKAFHGNIYQVKLSLLHGLHLLKTSDTIFGLGQEIAGGKKFDDLVVFIQHVNQNENEKKTDLFFLQAKHSQTDNREIMLNCLKKGRLANDNPFSLVKYYDSYKEIKKYFCPQKLFSIDSCFICTNFCFNDAVERRMSICEDGYPFFQKDNGKIYKVKREGDINEFRDILKNSNDFIYLAETLIRHMDKNIELQHWNPIYKTYHIALVEENILQSGGYIQKKKKKKMVKCYKFHDMFINGQLQGNAKVFRDAVFTLCNKNSDEISKIRFTSDKQFGIRFQTTDVFYCPRYVKWLYELINASVDKTCIEGIEQRYTNVLAGHVFVYANNKKTIKFANSFFKESFADNITDVGTKHNLKKFKAELKNQIRTNNPDYNNDEEALNVIFNEFKYCTFVVKTYETCYEYSTTLPEADGSIDQIIQEQDEFLGKLRFAVNQPNQNRLSDHLIVELRERTNLNDTKLIADYMLVKAIDWTAFAKSTIHYETEINGFVEEGKQKLAKIALTAPTMQYRNKMKSRYNDTHIIKSFEPFLQSNELQLLRICASDPLVVAGNVEKTLFNFAEKYRYEDSFIFSPLSFFIHLSETTVLAYKYPEEEKNLLIIVDDGSDSEDEAAGTFGQSLLELIAAHKTKKLIIISLEESHFANIFEEFNEMKRKDEKNIA